MVQIHLQLLGDFCLTSVDGPAIKLDTPRLRTLVAYLALHHHAPQIRHHLAFLFWPDSSEAQALTNLRKQLLYLRSTLPAIDTLLQIERQTIQWRPSVEFRLDVAEFEAALAHSNAAVDEPAINLLRRAIDLYRGELLPECYAEWVFPKREALREQYASALERLIRLLEEQRNYSAAIGYAQRLLRHDPLHESTYRCLMRLHALNGDRPTALRIYHTCVTHLREELGVDPDAETQYSYERLLHSKELHPKPPELVANVPFVGRQPEWQQLQQSWRIAMGGQPHFVLIAGEAGIGKTRLAEEFLSWAIHQGICAIRARCYAAEGRLTYAPVLDWLRSEALRVHRFKVESAWLSELARLLPELLREFPNLPAPSPITQSWQRQQLFEAMTHTLLAVNQPLLLLLDDLQWCDQETLEWLHFLMRITDNSAWSVHGRVRLMVVGTARFPDEVQAGHPLEALLHDLRGREQFTQIEPARLSEAETMQLAQQMMGRALSTQSLQDLYADTDGNPLFVVETVRAGQGQNYEPAAQDKVSAQPTPAPTNGDRTLPLLPTKVLAVLQARLGQLSPAARELCEWAAIIGREFTLELLTSASKSSEDRAVAALDELWHRRIIREHSAAAYDFSHDRLRDVAVMRISRIRRRHLHCAIAEVLESQSADQLDSVAAQIAVHYDAAGIIDKAISYYQQAAETSLHIYANQEAVHYLNRTLDLLHTMPLSRTYAECKYQILIMLGPPLVAMQGFGSQQLRDYYLVARKLAEQLNYPHDPSILRILAISYLTHRQFDLAYSFGAELLQIAQSGHGAVDPFLYVEGSYTLGVTSFWQGHFLQARKHLEQAIATYDRQHHTIHIARYGQDPGVVCLSRLAWVLWYLGYPEQATEYIQQAMALANLLKHPFSIEYALVIMQWLYYDIQDQSLATELEELVTAHQPQTDLPTMNQALGLVIRGKNLADCGLANDGIEMIRNGIAMASLIQYDLMFKSHFQAALAQALISAENFVQAHEAVDVALAHAATYHDNYYLAELYRLKGQVLLAMGEVDEVLEQCFITSLDIAHAQQAKSLELRAAMSLARLWAQQGKQSEAYALLAEIYGWFTEGFDTADLQEAKALLAKLHTS